jgi:hypothetical protein
MRSMKDEILDALARTVWQSVGDAVARTAKPAIRSAVDRAVDHLSAPLHRELDRLVETALRRATEKTGEAIRTHPRRR